MFVQQKSIIAGLLWFLSHILHTPFPDVVLKIASGATFVAFVVFVLRYCYEDLTEHGRQLKARNRSISLEEDREKANRIQLQEFDMPRLQSGELSPDANEFTDVQHIQPGKNIE